jgi:predicted unusual protein kinase regulating ubiquinone biosynthesis (AarF/ABC1/UbiB family)
MQEPVRGGISGALPVPDTSSGADDVHAAANDTEARADNYAHADSSAVSPSPLPFTSHPLFTAVSAKPSGTPDAQLSEVIFAGDSDIPPDLRKIWQMGIRSEEDIESALDYISFLDPKLAEVVELVRERMQKGLLRIDVNPRQKENSSARTTFNGRIDRNSNEFADVISIGVNAGPDVLFHEIVHSVPLSYLAGIFEGHALPALPPLDPSASYADLYAAVSEHGRVHEVISFGAQCLFYDIEKRHGAAHTFKHEMMSKLYGAWKQAGFSGIRTMFSTYLKHYVVQYDTVAATLSLIVKVEGRTNIIWEEYNKIIDDAPGATTLDKHLSVLEDYLKRFIRQKGLDVPPDFFSSINTIRRRGLHDVSFFDLIQSNFEAIEKLEGLTELKIAGVVPSPIEPGQIPPKDSQADRKTLFTAYSEVVDKILENPPPSFDRSELASLISFVRMVPAQYALDLARRLTVYIDEGKKDLGVTLGLILYEKGLHEAGRKLLRESVSLDILIDAWPMILKTVGPDVFAGIIDDQAGSYLDLRKEAAEEFRIWALDQFIFDDEETKRKFKNLFGYPETFLPEEWHTFAKWLVNKTEVDYGPEENNLLNTADLEEIHEFSNVHSGLLDLLNDLKNSGELIGVLNDVVEEWWNKILSLKNEGMAALREVLSLSEDRSLRIGIIDDLRIYSDEELDVIFNGYDDEMKKAVVSWGEIEGYEWWSYPGYVKDVMEEALKIIRSEDAGEDDKVIAFERFTKFMLASIDKMREAKTPPAGDLAAKLPLLIDRFLKVVTEDDSVQFENLKLLNSVHPFLPYLIIYSDNRSYEINRENWADYVAGGDLARVEWITKALELNHVNKSKLLKQGEKELRKLFALDRRDDENDRQDFLSVVILPYVVCFILQALKARDFKRAQSLYDFMSREIPNRYPPDAAFSHPDRPHSTWGHEYLFYQYRGRIEWAIRLEMERAKADGGRAYDVIIGRIRDELNRGGANIGIEILSHFARGFADGRDMNRFEDVVHLMMLKSCLGLGVKGAATAGRDLKDAVKNVKVTVKTIHNSPLPDEKKDELLLKYLEQLFDYIHSFRGADISLISRLEGLFIWRTPFMRAGDVPNYEKTEAFILRKLASIPELIDSEKSKNTRVRLAAFAAAGLPLQRYAEWLEFLFDDPKSAPAMKNMLAGRSFRHVLCRYNLPHPYDIPQRLSLKEAKDFVSNKWPVIKGILEGSDAGASHAALKVLSRFLGSDLRSEDKRSIIESTAANAVLDWLKAQYKSKKRSPFFKDVLRILFEAGPKEVDRLGIAKSMLRWTKSRQERRKIFDLATADLVFSKRVRGRLEALRAGEDETAELAYYNLLLDVRYDRHPWRMVSDFFLERLESDDNLRYDYNDYLEKGETSNVLVFAEMGAGNPSSEAVTVNSWIRTDMIERIEMIVNALRFLKYYVQQVSLKDLSYVVDGFIRFSDRHIDYNDPEIAGLLGKYQDVFDDPYLKDAVQGNKSPAVTVFASILSDMGWGKTVEKELNRIFRSESIGTASAGYSRLLDKISSGIESVERTWRSIYAAYQRNIRDEVNLPRFFENYDGLKQDILVWAFAAMDPAQRNLLEQNLETAASEKERILLFGRAAHFEKLLQLASIYPAVPQELKDLFSVFQEDVPHRDEIDAERTLSMIFQKSDMERLSINLKRPVKEGTIGGIYPGTYDGTPIVLKLQPEGKRIDLMDSLRIVRELRRNLAAGGFAHEGARALDDFLAFYQRVMAEEMNLLLEIDKAKVFSQFLKNLSGEFVIPEYINDLATPQTVMMKPLYSRRLKNLSDVERERVFEKIDHGLIPMMMLHGTFHFDLHPGNIGVTEDGKIAIYDVGRVHSLTVEENNNIVDFYSAVGKARTSGSADELAQALKKLGTVWDESRFKKIGEILMELVHSDDPFKAIEDIYPKLPQYGFRLSDSYVKLLLMHLTWEGTKESFRSANGNGGNGGGSQPPSEPSRTSGTPPPETGSNQGLSALSSAMVFVNPMASVHVPMPLPVIPLMPVMPVLCPAIT